MKRLLPLLLCLVLLLAACGAAPEPVQNAAPEPTAVPAQTGESREGGEDELPILTDDGLSAPNDGVPTIGGGTVTLDGISSYLRVDLPEGWTWAQAGGTADGVVYGLWPEDDPDFKLELHYWPNKFGMCGTGVTFADYTLPDGRKATLATEEIGEELSWILILPESPDAFTLQFCVKTELYEAHRAELELLLGTIRQGVRADLTAVTAAPAES